MITVSLTLFLFLPSIIDTLPSHHTQQRILAPSPPSPFKLVSLLKLLLCENSSLHQRSAGPDCQNPPNGQCRLQAFGTHCRLLLSGQTVIDAWSVDQMTVVRVMDCGYDTKIPESERTERTPRRRASL